MDMKIFPRARRHQRGWSIMGASALILALAACSSGSDDGPPVAAKPNILFIAIDVLAFNNLTAYGYVGAAPAKTPNLNAIAEAGLMCRRAWTMPTCTPTRATFFTGRYPSATNRLNALVSSDLANSEISPYE